jgi:KH domain-containing protein
MVKSINVVSLTKVKKAVPKIEKKLGVKILVNKHNFKISGKEYQEYLGYTILRAVDFGFDVEDAFLLMDENFVLEFVEIKEHTRRKNLKDVRARVIGRNGRAMKTIEELTGSVLFLRDNRLGIIVCSENLDVTVQAVESLIRGAKHSNVFSYIEKNKFGGGFIKDDLGLTKEAKKIAEKEGLVELEEYGSGEEDLDEEE